MEIPPTKADLDQVVRGKDGRLISITNDVQGIANQLSEIDPHLRLRYSESGEYFVVYWQPDGEEEGNGHLVTTAQELDGRLVAHVRKLVHMFNQPGFNYGRYLLEADQAAEKERDDAFFEANVDAYERLAHALRKDTGHQKVRVIPGKDITKNGD